MGSRTADEDRCILLSDLVFMFFVHRGTSIMFHYLQVLILASGSAGAAGLIHLPIMLFPAFIIGWSIATYLLKTTRFSIVWLLTFVAYVVLFLTRGELYFPIANWFGLL